MHYSFRAFRIATYFPMFMALLYVGQANGAVIVSLVGDKDGFGLSGAPAVPVDGTLWRDGLGGVFFTDYRDAGDLASAPFTDQWFTDAAIAYTHSYALGGQLPVSAALEIQTAGLADDSGPWDVLVNATVVGQIPTNALTNNFQETIIHTFNVPVGILSSPDSILLNINVPSNGDGYSINYSELRITTIPEPSTLALVGLGMLGVGVLRRKR